MKKILRNNEGLTLVEILAALVILGIVLVSFMSFFTQSAKFTAHNNEKLTAVQVAEEIVAEVRQGDFTENENLERYHYTVDIEITQGPVNLKKAEITVKSPEGAGINDPEFMTQMYFEESP